MQLVKIRYKVDGYMDWFEYSLLFFGRKCEGVDNLGNRYLFVLDNRYEQLHVWRNNERFTLRCRSIRIGGFTIRIGRFTVTFGGFTVVWRFESTLVEFIKDVWSKLIA